MKRVSLGFKPVGLQAPIRCLTAKVGNMLRDYPYASVNKDNVIRCGHVVLLKLPPAGPGCAIPAGDGPPRRERRNHDGKLVVFTTAS